MTIELKRPFSSYVAVQESDQTGDARKVHATFMFLIEGTDKVDQRYIDWAYSGTEEAVDQKAGVDGDKGRRDRAVDRLERTVLPEALQNGGRIYEERHTKLPVWGKRK